MSNNCAKNIYKCINGNWIQNNYHRNYDNFILVNNKISNIINRIIYNNYSNDDIEKISNYNNSNFSYYKTNIDNMKKLLESFDNDINYEYIFKLISKLYKINDNVLIHIILTHLGIKTFFYIDVEDDIIKSNYYTMFLKIEITNKIYNKKKIKNINKIFKLFYDEIFNKDKKLDDNIENILKKIYKIEKKMIKFSLNYNENIDDLKYKKISFINTKINNYNIDKLVNYNNIIINNNVFNSNNIMLIFDIMKDDFYEYINNLFSVENEFDLKMYFFWKFCCYIINIQKIIKNKKKIIKYISYNYDHIISPIYKIYLINNNINLKIIFKDVKKIFDNLIIEYINQIKKNKYIKNDNKIYILNKLKDMKIDIGFSKKNKKIKYKTTNNVIQNIFNINKKNYKFNLILYNKINDKNLWPIRSLDVNACYISNYNKIILPYGILNNPFYDYNFELYKKFSNLGTIIGHEISHSIDINGIKYDSKGNLNIKNRKMLFVNKIRKINKQFKKVDKNYKKKIGENISDLYGLSISLLAFKKLIYNKFKINDNIYKKYFKSLAEHRINITLHNIKLFRKLYNIKKNKNTVNVFNI